MLRETILDAVGKTPLVRLHRVGKDLKCNLFAKCEFLNPGGSIKDRIAMRMVEQAEKSGRIRPGDTLVEPTSGNTGIGLALAGAVKGYQVIIVMPEKMSQEKQVVLEALGAKIIRTPTEAAWNDPESHIEVSKRLVQELPRAHLLDQYQNPNNPLAHYYGTGQEILDALDGNVDMVVMGAGTGGTLTGVGQRIKEANPKCQVVAADPVGSILAGGDHVGPYKVEGIGYDFIPDVLDRQMVDKWVKTNDRQSFLLARQLIHDEGLICGGSSGAALYAALQEARHLEKGQNCVVILPDNVRNYMSKFIDDKWMQDNHFVSSDFHTGTVSDLVSRTDKQSPLVSIEVSTCLVSAVEIMKTKGFSQIPVVQNNTLQGLLREKDLLEYLLSRSGDLTKVSIDVVMKRDVSTVKPETPISALHTLLASQNSVIVIDHDSKPLSIITKIDFVEWMMKANR